MAAPRTKRPPARIQVQDVSPQVDCGRYPVEAHRRRPRRRSGAHLPRRSRDAGRRGAVEAARGVQVARVAAHSRWATTGGRARSSSTSAVAGAFASRRGSTGSRRGRSRCAASRTRARPTCRASLRKGRSSSTACRSRSRRGSPRPPATAARRRGRRRTTSTSTANVRGSAPGTSSSRARGAGSRASRTRSRSSPSSASTSSTCRRSTRSASPNRKGRNNAETAEEGDVGSPWAIGGAEGGHKAIHPELGTVKDFERLVRRGRELGCEICIDYAINCSPDHPWLRKHPEWFHRARTARSSTRRTRRSATRTSTT